MKKKGLNKKIAETNKSRKKKILEWVHKHIHAIGFIWLLFLVMGTTALAMGINPFYGMVAGQSAKITPTVTPEPTSDITPIIEEDSTNQGETYSQPVDSDPIISCTVEKIGVVQLKQSVCSQSFACQVGDWKLYQSREKCNQDQANYYGNKGGGSGSTSTQTTYQSSNYPPCTIHYSSWDHTYSGMSPDWCKSEQARVDAVNSSWSTTTNQTPQESVQTADNRYQDCMDQATQSYNTAKQNASFYGSGTREQMLQIAQSDYDRAVQNCNQYPH